jgi:tetratricopeptide (TPR) repeat protein
MLTRSRMVTIKKRGQKLSTLLLISCLSILLTACGPAGPRNVIKGEKLLRKGDYQGAIEKLELATQQLAKDPASVQAQAWNFLGLAFQQAGEANKALNAYQQALKLDRNLVEADYNMGVLFLENRNYPKAVDCLTTYITLRPKDNDGLLKLGTAHLHWSAHVNTAEKLRHLESARKSFEASRQIAPSAEAANALGVVHLQRNRPTDAQKEFNTAVKLDPNYAPAVLNLAIVAHQYQHDHKLALQRYREYLALTPTAENAIEIQGVVKSLEREFAPAPVVATPAPKPVAATPAPAPVTNSAPSVAKPASAPVVAAPVKTNPPAQPQPVTKPAPAVALQPPKQAEATPKPVVATAAPVQKPVVATPAPVKPAVSQTPAPVPAPVEVAEVTDAATPKAARDIATPAPQPAMPPVSAPRPVTVAAQSTEQKPEKKTILKKLNPVSWFGKKNKTKEVSEPAPEPVKETPLPEAKPVAAAAPSTVTPLPAAKPVIARYKYISPTKPRSGNAQAADKFVAQGTTARRNAHYEDAVLAFRNALMSDPANFDAAYYLGVTEQENSNIAESLPIFETALAIKPESTDARYAFAWSLHKSNFPQDAANELEKLLQQSPKDVKANLLLATLYAQYLSQPSLARDHYKKVLEADPRHPQATAIRFWLAANP